MSSKKDFTKVDPAKLSDAVRKLNPHLFGQVPTASAPTPHASSSIPHAEKRRKKMNKTEGEFEMILAARMRRDEIVSFEFEGLTLRWGGTENYTPMSYTPDFTVFEAIESAATDGHGAAVRIKFIEVKGAHIFDRDVVRFKGARSEWPLFAFEMWQKKGGEWNQIL